MIKSLDRVSGRVSRGDEVPVAVCSSRSAGGASCQSGLVKTVDAAARTIVLIVKEKGRESEATYQVAEDAKIHAGSKDHTLPDLKPGSKIKGVLRDAGVLSEIKWEKKDD